MKNIILVFIVLFLGFTMKAQVNYTNNTVASGASAIGENNTSTGTNSFVSGYNSQATGVYSTAIGHSSNASGMHSVALGSYSSAESPSGTAIGPHAVVGPNATGGVAVGNLVESHMPFSFVFGGASDYHDPLINNISSSLMIGFQSDIPTFFVGSASGPGTVGKVGVGTTSPVALLDVNGDINLSGNILKNGNPMQFSPWTNQGSSLYYTKGKVGIGTTLPSYSLDIRGSFNVSGTIYQNGQPFNPSQWAKAGGNISFMNGNVGIGISAPSFPLHIKKDVDDLAMGYDAAGIVLETENNTNGFSNKWKINNDGMGLSFQIKHDNMAEYENAASFYIWGANFNKGITVTDNDKNTIFSLNSASLEYQNTIKINGADNKVGIGTQSPEEKLHISNGKLLISNSGTELLLSGNDIGSAGGEIDFYHPSSGFNTLNCERIWVRDEIVVQNTDPWPDYVFNTDYPLMPINELANYISTHGKLPKMPSAEEVKENGQKLAKNQALLLEKTEELTLYIIELKKENEDLRERIEKIETDKDNTQISKLSNNKDSKN